MKTIDSDENLKLPPDQSLRIATSESENSFLLLSVSDAPLLLGKGSDYPDFSPYSKVHIFSESITFTGDLLSQHGISLFCNDIISVSPVKINTTGKDGDDQTPDALAENGGQGGPINFYIQSGSSEASESISFVANGGAGGNNTIEGSQAGNGGDGGRVVRIFQSNYSALMDSILIFLARKAKTLIHNESPVDQKDPIYIAASELFFIATSVAGVEEMVTDLLDDLNKRLSDIDNGTPVTNRELLITITTLLGNLEEKIISKQKDNFEVSVEFSGGDPGSGMNGKTGKVGGSGSDTYWVQTRYDQTIRQTELAFAHPEQCAMLLERAKIFYYMGLREKATDLFQRLLRRLSFLPLESGDPLYKAYTDSDIMPSNSLEQLESIKTHAADLYLHLITGLSYYGNKQNWVPRQRFTYLNGLLNKALEDHKAFEVAYIEYHAVLSKKDELQDSVRLAQARTMQITAGLKTDIDDLSNKLRESNISIQNLTVPVMATHKTLMDEYKIVKKKVKDHLEWSLPQLINALRSIAFAPNSGMGAVEGLDLAYQGITSIPQIDGTNVNKDVIIRNIQYGETTVENFKATLGKLNGEFTLDDPKATWIMTTKENTMKFLDSFVSTSLVDVVTEMKGKFDAFAKAILARNAEVLHYNILLKLIVKKLADKDNYKKKENDFQRQKIEVTDPDLPVITAYMGDIYQSSRIRVMNLLDNLVRSFNFRMLAHEEVYNFAFSGGTEHDQVPLSLTWVVLRSAQSQIQDKLRMKLQGYEPPRFPKNFDTEEGKKVYLSDIDVDRLKANPKEALHVHIPAVRKGTITKNPQFAGHSDVRIYRVYFKFIGLVAKEEGAFVSVKLTHSGREEIVDKDNNSHMFVHDPIITTYSFSLSPGINGKVKEKDNANFGEANVGHSETNYAPPGPFTDWEIDLSNSTTKLLDFSNVTKAYFEFFGTNYSF